MQQRHKYVDREHVDGCADCGQDANAPTHNAPSVDLLPMDALGFADYVRQLGAVARDLALVVPGFKARGRNDPIAGRAVKRYPAGPIVIVPLLSSRPAIDTKRDLVDGLCEANALHHDHPKRWIILDRMELT